jgi:DNA (cytosine-5)-methyltransferase 1
VIGNAVPPLVAEAVGIGVRTYLESTVKQNKSVRRIGHAFPSNEVEAVGAIQSLILAAEKKQIQSMATGDFLRGWRAISFLFPGLHPDGALEHGKEVVDDAEPMPAIGGVDLSRLSSHYARSGWPVLLAPAAKEAWRRYDAGDLKDDEFYCSEALMAGMLHRASGKSRRKEALV